MRFDFHPEARAEFRAAALWYEQEKTNLGREFIDAVEAGIAAILENPTRFGPIEKGVRRCALKRFPYRIHYLYSEQPQQVIIYAVMHVRRHPDYWKHRVPESS